jgi:hypothetical protein
MIRLGKVHSGLTTKGDAIALSHDFLVSRGMTVMACRPCSGELPIQLMGINRRQYVLLVSVVSQRDRLPALVRLMGDRRLREMVGPRCRLQMHVWSPRQPTSRRPQTMVCDVIELFKKDFIDV